MSCLGAEALQEKGALSVGLSRASPGTVAFCFDLFTTSKCDFLSGNMSSKTKGSMAGMFIKVEMFSLESR